ncbi:MAG: TonB-dependent receptor [Thermoanaerobaculales bacterium]|jgi:outer membrane receptor protein involved in Fe transport|nr:TonB-dependent receptor [Thermoanaerobaculales bacterium]
MRHRHLVLTWLAVSLVMIVCAPSLAAQEQTTDEDLILSLPEITFEGEVLVTGSLIPRADLTALSPVTVMDVPSELTYSGTVRIEDLMTTMPQVFAGQNSTVSNGATGTATIALRNLGPHRTLVLINGRRMSPGDASIAVGADLNVIPAPLVKRVDVLTGGASAVYGSDAMVGVVNFIMDTDFTGVRGGLQYSFHNHDNNNEFVQDLTWDAGFDYPTGWTDDGDAINANIAVGGKFADGKGHAAAYIDYRKIDALTKASRDHLNCQLDASNAGPWCRGDRTTDRGFFGTRDPTNRFFTGFYTLSWIEDGGDGHSFRPFANDFFLSSRYNHIQRPDEKWNAGAFANYEINEHFDVYMEVMYMNDYTDAQIPPSGNIGNVRRVNCDNPMLSQQQHDIVCTQGGYADDDYANVLILRRNVEGEPRSNQLGHTNIRMIGGLRGEINDEWSYDFYWLRAQNNSQDSYMNDLSPERMGNALDIIEDPDTGEWVCRAGSDDGCVPWNIFQEGAVTPEAVDYISTVAVQYGTSATQVFNLTFTSDWEHYGLTIPCASEGIQLAVGAEYREESLRNRPDEVYLAGNTAGAGLATLELGGAFNVKEAFVELLVPVVQDSRGASDLSLELGYRWSDYSTAGNADTYKAMASWAITDSWRLRGGYNRAVRAPNIVEIFNPPQPGGGPRDPCEGEAPAASFEECARMGVTAAQYGNLPVNIFPGSHSLQGGNPQLYPETADTLTAGMVWTPRSITGLSVTLDYYDIEIADAITTIWTGFILDLCRDTGDPFYCGLIHRDAQGSLWLTADGYIDGTLQNIGMLSAEGVDLNLNYLIGLGGAGFLATDLMGSYMLENGLQEEIFDFDCAGYYGETCGQPRAEWRHRLRATWETAFRLNLSLAWRYLGGVEIDAASPDPNLQDPEMLDLAQINGFDTIRAYNWFDLAASYTFRNGIKLTLGVNNILDEEPPILPDLGSEIGINLYANYDPLGRYVFGSLQFNF